MITLRVITKHHNVLLQFRTSQVIGNCDNLSVIATYDRCVFTKRITCYHNSQQVLQLTVISHDLLNGTHANIPTRKKTSAHYKNIL